MDTALLFSGGKDSLACLYLNKHRWDSIFVVWLNTGAADEETYEYMMMWKERLPHFVELKSDQPSQVEAYGWPVDVLPVNNTHIGKHITGEEGPLMQPYLNCCASNIWFPLHEGVKALGVTRVIKGQRNDDEKKSVSRNGDTRDGITFEMPIQDWTEDDVWEYLDYIDADIAPGYIAGEKTGRDCWNCTAYLSDNKKRIANLPADKKQEVLRRLGIIKAAIDNQWNWED
jgi:3'-phosphoadenosine 5'-phosphosulfate sulfotransferase (PAPS reductase)/FAD synthetase